jgi:ParB/RepB/Spo0J family partition protein
MKTTLHQVALSLLKPHPRNSEIYGDEDVSELVELIRESAWVKPLVVTLNHTIISGHRRWKAVCLLGWETVAVEYREFPDQLAELEALLLENASRLKTTEQKVREAQAWQEVEAFQARQRKLSNLKQGNSRPDVENFPHRGEQGKTRDRIAARVGLGSGRTYSKAAKVIAVVDEEIQKGNKASAQVLRKVLNEQSVDAAHTLIKKPPQERHTIANLIATGEAKSTFQARQMVRQKNYAEFNDPTHSTLAGFSMGDWVEVNNATVSSSPYIGQSGQVEQIWVVEQQISVNLGDTLSKVRFYPHELTLIAKATPPCPLRVCDLVVIDIDRHEAVSSQEKKWNGCWGKVTQIGEMGSVTVDVGSESLQLFPRDLKPIDAPSVDLQDVVERVLRLRGFELDEIEERMLDVFQLREWFTNKQMIHLKNIETLYLQTLYAHDDPLEE